jgi:hypothetical protein
MKELHLLENAITLLANQSLISSNPDFENDVKSLLVQFLRINTILKVRNEKFDLYKYAANKKENTRPILQGILYQNGYKVATDASILCAIKSQYNAELEGKTVAADGKFLDGTFPNWRMVIVPIEDLTKISFEWNVSDILKEIAQTKKLAKGHKSDVWVSLELEDGTLYSDASHFSRWINFLQKYPDCETGIRRNLLQANYNDDICLVSMTEEKYKPNCDYIIKIPINYGYTQVYRKLSA